MRDDNGVSQLWTVSPNGGQPRQLTNNQHDIDSAFSWSPDGKQIAHVMHETVCVTNAQSGESKQLTIPNPTAPLRPQACVFSPDGSQIAYLREVTTAGETWNQVFTVAMPIVTNTNKPKE
jgi:Tol biopolymer transport system component